MNSCTSTGCHRRDPNCARLVVNVTSGSSGTGGGCRLMTPGQGTVRLGKTESEYGHLFFCYSVSDYAKMLVKAVIVTELL